MTLTPEMLVALSNVEAEDAPLPASVAVELPAEEVSEIAIDPETGAVLVDIASTGAEEDEEEFGANLAETLPEDVLDELGRQIVEWVEQDEQGRADWWERIAKGLATLGVARDTEETAGELTDVGRIDHPLVLEAATQFQARTMGELYPPGGPVKSQIVGVADESRLAQGERIEQFMNYQLTVQDRGYYDDRDAMMFRLAFTGSEFDKQYYDERRKQNRSRWVKCEDFIVPVGVTSLEDAPRYTHRLTGITAAKYKAGVTAGLYREVELGTPSTANAEENPVAGAVAAIQGEEVTIRPEADAEYTFYECHLDDHDLAEDARAGGEGRPYVATVDKASGKVVALYRNWREADETAAKRLWFTHKKMLPGLGFYGWGFLHTLGNLGQAASQILNILLDAGAFSALQGGFKSKDVKLPGDSTLEPGLWKDTEMAAEELQRAFYTPPYREPSAVLNALLGAIETLGRRFASTTDQMVGDAANTGPVGTTVALIEQGSKVYSGIHKRLHKACGDEFIHLAELNGEHLPDTYPFAVNGREYAVAREDFDARIDVVPVSDPAIFSAAQRIAQAQTALQMAQSMPDVANKREAARELLKAVRLPNVDKIVPEPAEAAYADPVSEGALAMVGRPLKAFLQQHHGAHIAVHQTQAMQLQQINPQAAQAMFAHLQEHMAMAYTLQMQQMLGMPLPSLRFGAPVNEPMLAPLPAEVEQMIALRAAAAVQQMQAQQQPPQQPSPPQGDPVAEEARKDAATAAEERRKDAAFAAGERRKDAQFQHELALEAEASDRELKIDPELLRQAKAFVAQTGLDLAPKRLAAASQALGKPFVDVVKALAVMEMQGQGGGPAPLAMEIQGRRGYA